MQVLLGLAILVTIALLASSERFYRLRRTRWGAPLTTGGWMMVAIGFAIGPWGARLVTPEHLMVVQPLILFCLGWVGLVIGFQAHRRLPSLLPRAVAKLSILDAALTMLIVGGTSFALLYWIERRWQVAMPGALLLSVASIGWSPEVRSLRAADATAGLVTGTIRAAGGLSSLLAVCIYGLLIAWLMDEAVEANALAPLLSLQRIGGGLLLSLIIGVAMGLLGTWLMGLVGRSEGEFLVVLIGLVAFAAGGAATIGHAPLFVALITGAIIVNLPSKPLERFRRVIIDAEQAVAMVLMLVAGVMVDPLVGPAGLVMVVVLLLVRVIVKQGLVRSWASTRLEIPRATAALAGLMRQSPVAIALVAGYAVMRRGRVIDAEFGGRKLLAVIILMGLLCELWPFVQETLTRWRKPAEPPAAPHPPPQPEAGR